MTHLEIAANARKPYADAISVMSAQAGVNHGPFIANASTEANARLIAAAPDLLAALIACKNTIEIFIGGDCGSISLAKARAAITKAEGVSA